MFDKEYFFQKISDNNFFLSMSEDQAPVVSTPPFLKLSPNIMNTLMRQYVNKIRYMYKRDVTKYIFEIVM